MEPPWLSYAREFIGQREVLGSESNTWIEQLWFKLRSGPIWRLLGSDDSSAPWCGLLVASCFNELGYPIAKNFFRALAWLDWGVVLDFPVSGAVVVFKRKGGGHVGFVVGEDQNGDLMVLGGNQNDAVNIMPFSKDRVLGYRWPAGEVVIIRKLPLIESGARISTNEA